MYRPILRCAILMSILGLTVLTPAIAPTQVLGNLLEQASIGRNYQPISPGEFLQAEYLFLRTLKGECSYQLRQEWQSLGFTMKQVNENGSDLLVLHESEGRRLGRGFYAFHQSLPRPIALQAPHSFKEYHTRQIILTMMRESNAAAAAWNTVPRTFKQFGATIDADVAHQEFTFYKAFSRAFATLYTNGYILQMHGFAQEKRKTQAASVADIILSSGRQNPGPAVLGLGQCLKQHIPGVVQIYPRDVLELGATTNSIGHTLMQIGHQGFIHIEVSRQIRQRMLTEPAIRLPILQCLATVR